MAMIDTAQRAPFGAITTHRVISGVHGVLQTIQSYLADRIAAAATAQELGRLNARMLDDIGMTQADVERLRIDTRLI